MSAQIFFFVPEPVKPEPVYSSAADGLFLVKKGCCLFPWPALDVSLCDDVDSEEYGAPGSRALLVAARVWTNSGGEVVSSPSP